MLTLPAPRQSRLWCPSLSGSSCSSSGSECTADSPSLDDDPPFEVPVPDAPPVKKIRNVRKSNIHKCTVCGDKPTGYHYDVLSCNGCKTFFRRTVINQRRFRCSRGGNCEFTKDFRCACRACRFDKCVKAGMNPKAIQFPTSAAEKQDELMDDTEDLENALVTQCPPVSVMNDEDLQYMLSLDMMIHRENAVQSLRSTQFPVFPAGTLLQILRQPSILGKRGVNKGAVDNEQIETYRLMPIKFWMVADLFLSVEFAKSFKVFQEMNKYDQQRMLANAAAPLQISTQAYYSESDGLTFPDGMNALYYQMVVMKRHQFEHYYRDLYSRPVEIMRRLQLTHHEFALFKAVTLFAPDNCDLSDEARNAILVQRHRLAKILRKHLMKEYGAVKGTEKFGDCLIAISSLVSIGEKRRNYLHVCEVTEKMRLTKIGQGIYLKRFDLDAG